MKKLVVLAAMAAIFGSFAFAEVSVELGVKGGVLLNAGTKLDEEYGDSKMTVGGDVGIFSHIGLVDLGPGKLSLQPEVFFSINNGIKNEVDEDGNSAKFTVKYNSLDIAVLIGYDIPVGKISIRPFVGPKLGIPLGKMKMESEWKDEEESVSETGKFKMKGATIGLDFGCGVAIPLGKFVLGAEVRYGIDFNKVQAKNEESDKTNDILRRGALGINISAAYKF